MVKQVAKNPNQQPTIPQPKVKKSKGKAKGREDSDIKLSTILWTKTRPCMVKW